MLDKRRVLNYKVWFSIRLEGKKGRMSANLVVLATSKKDAERMTQLVLDPDNKRTLLILRTTIAHSFEYL